MFRRMLLATVFGIAVVFLVPLDSPYAQEQSGIEYIGDIKTAGNELRQIPHADGEMLANPQIAFVILERRGSDTAARLRYPGGERSLRFEGQVSEFRVLAQAGREFTLTARVGDTQCFTEVLRVNRPGVWRLKLPC